MFSFNKGKDLIMKKLAKLMSKVWNVSADWELEKITSEEAMYTIQAIARAYEIEIENKYSNIKN